MSEPVLTKVPSRTQIRAELEAMVVDDLLGPAQGESESEEPIDRDVRRPHQAGARQRQSAKASSATWEA